MSDVPKITPCLCFAHEAEAAVAHYIEVFGDAKIIETNRYGDTFPERKGEVLAIVFELFGQRYLAINGPSDQPFTFRLSLQVDCANQEEVDRLWGGLTDGGEESWCGWLKDRFGVSWQITPRVLSTLMSDPDPVKAQRVMEAMMTMRKIDIAAIQAAYDRA